MRHRRLVAAAAALSWSALAGCTTIEGFPPLYERETDLPGGVTETRAFFGLVSRTEYGGGVRLSALRPLVAEADDGRGTSKLHVLAPIGYHVEGPGGAGTKGWPLFSDVEEGDDAARREGASDDDTFLFPLFAWGHEPEQGSYFAFFPFGGTLKQKFLSDRIDFAAFPAYVHTHTGDWNSTHLLWPLVAWGESPTKSHFRVMPFWSQTDTPTRHDRTLLWPVGHWATEVRGDRTFDSWFVFPLAGQRDSRDGSFREWTALWPFFEFSHDDRTGDDYRAIVWPIHKHWIRPGRSETTWWWPVWGNYRDEDEDSSFYVWPIGWAGDGTTGSRRWSRRYVVPVWMRRSSGPKDGEPDQEELRSWPLFSWRRMPGGVESVRVPEIVPFFGWEAGETLYADVLTLFRWSADRDGRSAWDGPLGLVRYRSDTKRGSRLTLLWWISIGLGDGR